MQRTLGEVTSLHIKELALLRNPKRAVYTEMLFSVGRPLNVCRKHMNNVYEKYTFTPASVVTVSERVT